MGHLVRANDFKDRTYVDFNAYWFRLYQDDESNPNWRTEPRTDHDFKLSFKDYCEIKEAMINEIKQNPRDWKIEKEKDLTVVRHKLGRKHWFSEYRRAFSGDSYVRFKEEEWQAIEKVLTNSSQREEKPSTNQNPKPNKFPITGIILLLTTFVILLVTVFLVKRKRQRS